jgi:hypothetical protein
VAEPWPFPVAETLSVSVARYSSPGHVATAGCGRPIPLEDPCHARSMAYSIFFRVVRAGGLCRRYDEKFNESDQEIGKRAASLCPWV